MGTLQGTVLVRQPAKGKHREIAFGHDKGIVQPDGSIRAVEVVKSLDTQYGLDEAAIGALEQWRFEPGTRNGLPVPVQVFVDLTFKLR